MTSTSPDPEWLRQYGNAKEYAWRESTTGDGRKVFQRPIGLVEYAFDTDGRYFQGRADMSCLLECSLHSTLSPSEFRERILLAWTRLRNQHILLQARTTKILQPGEKTFAPQGLHFAVDVPENVAEARERAGKQIVFVEDFGYERVDERDFFMHSMNGGRVVDPQVALAKCFVLPVEGNKKGKETRLRVLFVGAHMIWDGLSSYVWLRDFITALNTPPSTLHSQIVDSILPSGILRRAPLPQEALYPPIHPRNKARQRWFWAITRILRHVRKPLPVGFPNPLLRPQRREAISLSPIYDSVFDYKRTPPNNSTSLEFKFPAGRLHRICKSVSASIGAGIFALVALTMMEFHEKREPDVPLSERKSFITGFPLNPRAFFDHKNEPESMMLAFSDGISLPFLPSTLPLTGRLRLLTRQAHRQLLSYQKRPRPSTQETKNNFLHSRGAGLVLANQYLYSLERTGTLPQALNLQGAYPAKGNPTGQTCGVSSVGLRDRLIMRGVYDVENGEGEMVVDFRDLIANVRAREGEFLVGAGGSGGEVFVAVSVDTSSLDCGLVGEWRERMMHVLDEEGEVREAKL